MKLPEQHELLWLFEAEPSLLHDTEPWCYNVLTFKTVRQNDELTFVIDAAYGYVQFNWNRGTEKVLNIKLERVIELRVLKEEWRESMLLDFETSAELPKLEFQLKPMVFLSWPARLP